MLKLKLQYFGHVMQRTDSLKKTDDGKDWRQEEKGMTEDEMVGWHHWLYGHEFVQALGVGDGQGSLACCSPWGRKELDTTEWLNWTDDLKYRFIILQFCSSEVQYRSRCWQGWVLFWRLQGRIHSLAFSSFLMLPTSLGSRTPSLSSVPARCISLALPHNSRCPQLGRILFLRTHVITLGPLG